MDTPTLPSAPANFRDLGGLPTEAGGATRPGILYRADAPQPGDRAPAAVRWPPAVAFDLRSPEESAAPHPLAALGSDVRALPLLAAAKPPTLAELASGAVGSVAEIYRGLLPAAEDAVATVLTAALAADGPVLLHCAAGKDRTGILVALLLRLAGVTREAVVEDFTRTTAAMPEVARRLGHPEHEVAVLAREFPDMVSAPAHAIEAVLDDVESAPGGVTGRLEARGVAPDLAAAWRAGFTTAYSGRRRPGSPEPVHTGITADF